MKLKIFRTFKALTPDVEVKDFDFEHFSLMLSLWGP